MKLDADLMVAMHRGTMTPEAAWAEQARRDESNAGAPDPMATSPDPSEPQEFTATVPEGPGRPPPDLCVYIPYSATGNLGDAYNRVMARLRPGEWAVFLDHDAMILLNDFWSDLQHAIATHPDAGAITCWTNRTGNSRQKAKAPQSDDIQEHTARAAAIRREYGQRLSDITGEQLTGVLFAVSRTAWDLAGPFREGFGEVDNGWARQTRAAGLRLWRMDGQYIYHQRRTNGWRGATRPEMDCRGAQWAFAKASPIIEAHGCETMRQMVDAHRRLVEDRTDWSDCQKSARRKAVLAHWRGSMRVSVVIPAREEPPEELARTVASFRQGPAVDVTVIDDGSTVPVSASCGADRIIRHDVAQGVSACRNEGLRLAAGNVIVYSDSHCHIADGCSITDWAYEAYCSEVLLCSVCGSYEDPEKWFWGCSLTWRDWRFDVAANRHETVHPAGVFGSVYAAARWTWDRIGQWPPTRGWGYNEQALSLACHRAGVPIRIDEWFRTRHKFRTGVDKKFPYPVSGRDFAANAPWVHWLLFDDPAWLRLRDATAKHSPEALAWMQLRLESPDAASERARYASLRRVTDAAVLQAIGAGRLLAGTETGQPVDGISSAPGAESRTTKHSDSSGGAA